MIFARLFKIAVYCFWILNAILLLGGVASQYFNPKAFWYPAFAGLFFKIFFSVNLFFILVFIIGRLKKTVAGAVLILLVCLPAAFQSFAFWPFHTRNQAAGSLKVMTYNIDNLGFLQDSNKIHSILKNIKAESPDIICFQEYLKRSSGNRFIARLQKMGYRHYNEYLTEMIAPGVFVGQAVFSKISIGPHYDIPFKETSNGCFYTDVYLPKDTLRLYNIHFQSNSLRPHEMKIPSSLQDFQYPQRAYYRMFFTKLGWAYEKRGDQVDSVKASIKECPYKVIVCGDFNDTPVSYSYHVISAGLGDAFLRAGFGTGTTFHGKIPLQRIDYILVSPSLKTGETHVLHSGGSDHFPLVSTVYW